MFNKAIKTKFKVVLQFLTSIWEIDTYCWKGWKLNKKEKNSNPYKEEKTKPTDSQPTTLAGITTQASNKNHQRTRKNCCNQQLDQTVVNTPATIANLVNTTPTNNFGDGQNRTLKDIS